MGAKLHREGFVLTTLKDPTSEDRNEALRHRLGALDQNQIEVRRSMTPSRRLELAFQTHQFALDVVRLTERQRHPGLSSEELAWWVTRRIHGDPSLGK